MQENWSLILNVLLLIGVIVAIGRLMKARRRALSPEFYQPAQPSVETSPCDAPSFNDDIIAVRKVTIGSAYDVDEELDLKPFIKPNARAAQPRLMPQDEFRVEPKPELKSEPRLEPKIEAKPAIQAPESTSLMVFLVAKENRQFAGYELLQTVLAAGLRFGEGNLFYRHQFSNGQGPVLCGLAAATPTGVFDLQNIGAFSVRGLCLFMHASKNPSIDAERFAIMLETARQLSEGLDATILDDQRKPLNDERLERYYRLLQIEKPEYEAEALA